ncbi:hypothetical protein CXF59_02685 [Flavobacterium sp. ALD4]|nr:hypothetical protein CXF59_02685 [Flavobacterium sp. ALD4]
MEKKNRILNLIVKMKPLNEKLILKDATIHKVQFDTEWFYKLDDMAFYLKEDLSEVDFIFLPFTIDGEQEFVKCSSFEDIYRGRIEFK